MNVLVTGARGFIGHAIAEHLLEETDWLIYYQPRSPCIRDRITEIENKERMFVYNDEKLDIIIHTAGNCSSIDCIENPEKAIHDNIILTFQMLELARKHKVKHFLYTSTAEVYGDQTGKDSFEDSFLVARNPYAATKAAGEHLCTSYENTYGVPCSIVRLSNNFGKRCQPERFPVLAIRKIVNNEKFIIHCDEKGNALERLWIPVSYTADMILFILRNCKPGKIYNLTGSKISNITLLEYISEALAKEFEYEFQPENIEGRVNIQNASPNLIHSLGWKPKSDFKTEVKNFVQWTIENDRWLR